MTETVDVTDIPRAGVWRRLLALFLDFIIIGTPFQIAAAILFATTTGFVQMSGGGLVFKVCEPIHRVPAHLVPVPPKDPNFATECRFSFLGLQTGQSLTVGRSEKQGNTTKNVFRTYMVDLQGNPVEGFSLDGYFGLALMVYLLAMAARRGATLGDKALKIAIIDVSAPQRRGIPLLKAFARYCYMLIGAVPAIVLLAFFLWQSSTDIDAAAARMFEFLPIVLIAYAAWVFVLVVQIARKQDPVYDRLAGTAVIRRPPP